jgi:predicted transposase YbfD/YdcC
MGCQKKIAEQIIEQQGDYVLALKDNHKTLYKAVQQWYVKLGAKGFEGHPDSSIYYSEETSHGRIEERQYGICRDISELPDINVWTGIKSVGVVYSRRTIEEKTTEETRFYLCSIEPDAALFAKAVRSHWLIENSCHYVLDVTFKEDACRICTDNAPKNFSIVRKLALTILNQDTTSNRICRRKQRKARDDNNYLESLLTL